MSDDADAAVPTPGRLKHNTAETYQRLLDIEVKTLLGRVTEITSTVDRLFNEVGIIMMQTEDMLGKIKIVSGSISFHHSEITELRKAQQQQAAILARLLTQVDELRRELRTDPQLDADVGGETHS